jgi:hypothetical protein
MWMVRALIGVFCLYWNQIEFLMVVQLHVEELCGMTFGSVQSTQCRNSDRNTWPLLVLIPTILCFVLYMNLCVYAARFLWSTYSLNTYLFKWCTVQVYLIVPLKLHTTTVRLPYLSHIVFFFSFTFCSSVAFSKVCILLILFSNYN